MKKQLLILLTTTAGSIFAQIPNASFEQVTTQNGICGLGGTATTAPTGYYSTPNTNATTTVAHSGSNAAMVSSTGGQADILETMNCSTYYPSFPYSGPIATAMTAWVRRAGSVNDSLTIVVEFLDGSNTILAAGQQVLSGAGYSAYTQVTCTVASVASGSPAGCLIAFTSGKQPNSSWYIDDLAFVLNGIAGYGAENFSAIYDPNSNTIEVKTKQSVAENISVSVSDMLGRKVTGSAAQQLQSGNSIRLSTSGLPQGIYLVQVLSGNAAISTQRVFIQ
jgi:hypothetical protein